MKLVNAMDRPYMVEFIDLLQWIEHESTDRNAGNYLRFFVDHIDTHEDPNMVIDLVIDEDNNDRIVAFSNLYGAGERYPPGYARALNRFWMHPDYRKQALSSYSTKHIGSSLMLPAQIARAKALELEAVFVSMEKVKRRPMLQQFVDYNDEFKFHLLPHMYNTCGDVEHWTCWQNVAVHWLGNSRRLPLARMDIDKWQELYS